MNLAIKIRAHHGLCLLHFKGKGYSPEFVENMIVVCNQLKQNPNREIVLVSETDLICSACPHNAGGDCKTSEKVAGYDKKCMELCELKKGQILLWREFRQILIEKVLQKKRLQEICSDCCWNKLCEEIDDAVFSIKE